MNKKVVFLGIAAVIVLAGGALAGILVRAPAQVQVGGSFAAMLSGAEEVPPVTTMSTGSATFTVSPDGMSMTFMLNVSNMTDITASHIHIAPMGVNGPVVVPLFTGPKPGAFSGVLAQGTITAADLRGVLLGMLFSALVNEIVAGRAYVNVHTTVNPAGEIRGQIR